MRIKSFIVSGLIGLVLSLPALAHDHKAPKEGPLVPAVETLPGHEADTYRYGQLLGALRGTTPRDCELVCSQNQRCMSWSHVPATFQMGPVCELKATVGPQTHRPGAVSGIALRLQPGMPLPQRAQQPVRRAAPPPPPRAQQVQRPMPDTQPIQTVKTPAPKSPLMGGPQTAPPAQSALVAQPETRPAPQPVPVAQTKLAPKSPPGPSSTRNVPQFTMVPPPQAPAATQAAPTPQTNTQAVAPVQPQTVQAQAPIVGMKLPRQAAPVTRVPWTERTSNDADYSVSGNLDYVPGDEQATAGYGQNGSGGQ